MIPYGALPPVLIDIGALPPPGLNDLPLGAAVELALGDARHAAYLTHRTPIFSMPIEVAPGKVLVLYGGTLLSFALAKIDGPGYEPPVYSVVVSD